MAREVTLRAVAYDSPCVRTPLLALAAVLALAACTSPPPAAPPPVTSVAPTSTAALALYDQWSAEFDRIPRPEGAACPPGLARTKTCSAWLAQITSWAMGLEEAIRARPDVDRYTDTLDAISKVTAAAKRYAPCPEGGGKSPAQCQDDALEIGLSPVGVLLKLHNDDIPR